MKNHARGILAVASIALLTVGCKDNSSDGPSADDAYDKGVIVINGGNFSQNNGTLSFLNRDSDKVELNIYNAANGQGALPPADGRIEGYAEAAGIGMILFDNMSVGLDKVTFVEGGTMVRRTELAAPEIENPRAVVVVNDHKAYITNWDSFNSDYTYKEGFITVVDPATGKSTGKIAVGKGPEEMVLHQKKVYVGRAATGSKDLMVVDTGSDAVTKSITFKSEPNPIGVDAAGKLWVKDGPRLHRLDPSNDQIEVTLTAGNDESKSIRAATLTADKSTLIFVLSYFDPEKNFAEVGNTFAVATTATTLTLDKPLISRSFSGLSTDPVSRNVYAGVSPTAIQSGYVLRINNSGVLQDSVKVEISPEGFFFK